jgi:streptogramin lyase
VFIIYGYAGSETKITGYTSLSYTQRTPGDENENVWKQTMSLKWIDQLYRNKIILGLDLLFDNPSDEALQIRPTWSTQIRGYQYNLNARYFESRDEDYQGGQTALKSNYKTVNLVLTPPDLPRFAVTYSSNRYLDDLTIHSVNSFNERKAIKADYQLGSLNLSASRTEYLFWSKPEMQDTQTFTGLVAVSVDAGGNVYLLSNVTYTVQVYTVGGNFIREFGGFGSGSGKFYDPIGIAVDNAGSVYVSDAHMHNVQKFSYTGEYITQWGGFGSGNGKFNSPNGIAIDHVGSIYIVDQGNNRIQKFSSSGSFITAWGIAGSAGNGQFSTPIGIAIDQNGYVYITDAGNHRVQQFDSNGNYLAQWGGYGSNDGEFNSPTGIVVDDQGYVYVLDYGNHRIQRFTTAGGYLNKWTAHGSQSGNAIVLGPGVRIYESDLSNGLVQIYSADGSYITSFGDLVTVTSVENRYQTENNQVAINYAMHPSDYFNFNFGYNVTNTHRKGTSMATTDSLYQQYNFGWQVSPVDFAAIYGSHNLVLTNSETNDKETQNAESRTHDFGLSLRPYEQANVTLGYSRSEFTEDSTANTRSDNAAVSVSSQLYPDLNMSTNLTHSETFSQDTKTSRANQIGITMSSRVLPEATADIYFTHNESKNLLDDSDNTGDALGFRWHSYPNEKLIWNETIQWSKNRSQSVSDGIFTESHSTQLTYSTELNYWIRRSLNLTFNSTYIQNIEQPDTFTYTNGFTWRPKPILSMTNSWSQTLGEADSSTFSSTFELRFRYQTRLSLGYRLFEQQDKDSIQTIYARLTKTF